MIVLKTISAVQYQCQIIVFALVLVFFGSLLFIKDNQMFNMRRTREKVVATVVDNAVALLEQSDVTGLGDRVTAEVYDAWRQLLQQCCNNVGM